MAWNLMLSCVFQIYSDYFCPREWSSVNYILSYWEILKGIAWHLAVFTQFWFAGTTISSGHAGFALFATCGMLLISQATCLPLLFLILLLQCICFWERKIPSKTQMLGTGKSRRKDWITVWLTERQRAGMSVATGRLGKGSNSSLSLAVSSFYTTWIMKNFWREDTDVYPCFQYPTPL